MRTLGILIVILGSVAPAYASCLSLSPGHTVSGQALWEDAPFECVILTAPIGEQVTVQVTSSAKDVAFTIEGEVDNQDFHSFTTKKTSYKITVYRMFVPKPVEFELSAK